MTNPIEQRNRDRANGLPDDLYLEGLGNNDGALRLEACHNGKHDLVSVWIDGDEDQVADTALTPAQVRQVGDWLLQWAMWSEKELGKD